MEKDVSKVVGIKRLQSQVDNKNQVRNMCDLSRYEPINIENFIIQ